MAQQSEPTADLIQHASIAGELARNLWGRTDFDKYDSAWAEARNWMVDYRGGLFTRAGFEFGDVIEWTAGGAVKFVPFMFSPDTSNTYVCVFTKLKVRFIQSNAWVLEAAKTIASVANGAGNRITVTSNAHGFADGDLVKVAAFTHASLLFLNTRTIIVANKTANTFDLADAITGSLIVKAGITTSAGTASRVYTITSPYSDSELEALHCEQIRDTIRLTHRSYPVKNLVRTAHTTWAISNEVFTRTLAAPTGVSNTADSAGGYFYLYRISAIDEDGEESLPVTFITGSSGDIMGTSGPALHLLWTPVVGAVRYRIYRGNGNNSNNAAGINPDAPVGFVAEVTGNRFTDEGVTPDFSRTPLKAYNPFANGRIKYVDVTTPGTTYEWDGAITWPAGGTGASGYLAIEGDGNSPVRGVVVIDGGKDYTGTTVTAAGGAADAVMTAALSPATGNYPACSAFFQQRQLYAATDNFPLRIFGTRPGLLSNFDFSVLGADDDSYEFDLDTDRIAPIRHLVSMRGGLAVFSQVGCWIVSGRETGNVLTANTAEATPQNTVGASIARPVVIDAQILYAAEAGQELRLLLYDDYNHIFQASNVSVLSNHLFAPSIRITGICWAQAPYKIAYAVQNNGRLIALTLDTQNSVFAMTPQWTQGYFRAIASIEESAEDRLYVAVERYVQSTRCLFFERLQSRMFPRLEEAFCVDGGLSLGKTAPTGRLTPSTLTGAVVFGVTGGTPFAAGDVGKIIRCGEGKATITVFNSNINVSAAWTRDLDSTLDVFPNTTTPKSFDTGEWWMDSTVTTVRGMWHMIGQSISVLADGQVVTGKTVDTDGVFTLSTAASRVHAGLGFTARAVTLPPTVSDSVIEGQTKDITGIAFRVNDTYGLKVGGSPTDLKDAADQNQRRGWTTVNSFRNDIIDEKVRSAWSKDQPVYIVQSDPLPACILHFIRRISLGDES